ncbi:MAG: hypothetical protein HKN47_11595, partial [Pirellulaceae bacterium]|nr:hypothetical protein [Pirellulaceae bacterium]
MSITSTSTALCELCLADDATGQASESMVAATAGFFTHLFATDGFPPRWECGTGWTPGLGWLHIVSDFAIFGAYFAIPIVLAYFITSRDDVPFPPVLWLFAGFIAFCGIG